MTPLPADPLHRPRTATTSREVPFARKSGTPTPPTRSTPDDGAPQGFVGLGACSARTSHASTRHASSESSFARNPHADARNTRARRSPSAGAEKRDRGCPASRAGAAESGIPRHARPAEPLAPAWCSCPEPGASAPTAPGPPLRHRRLVSRPPSVRTPGSVTLRPRAVRQPSRPSRG